MSRITPLAISDFMQLSGQAPLLDARSEGEFESGHIPGAIPFPILNNEQRAMVGTCYKQKGHEPAVVLGFKLAGPHFHEMIAEAYSRFPDRKVLVHCYRGGLRSRILSYVLHAAGFDIGLLVGGYKAYRQYVIKLVEQDLRLKVIGGYTGSGKSLLLHELQRRGEQVLDIEALANHRGSSFGAIGLPPQPTQEQFENDLACALAKLNPSHTIWIEDENRMTGKLKMPDRLYEQLRTADTYVVEKTFEERMNHILETYGRMDRKLLGEATCRLKKRLGDLRMREAIDLLEADDMHGWLRIVLAYYDKTYAYGLSLRAPHTIRTFTTLHELI